MLNKAKSPLPLGSSNFLFRSRDVRRFNGKHNVISFRQNDGINEQWVRTEHPTEVWT